MPPTAVWASGPRLTVTVAVVVPPKEVEAGVDAVSSTPAAEGTRQLCTQAEVEDSVPVVPSWPWPRTRNCRLRPRRAAVAGKVAVNDVRVGSPTTVSAASGPDRPRPSQ